MLNVERGIKEEEEKVTDLVKRGRSEDTSSLKEMAERVCAVE